ALAGKSEDGARLADDVLNGTRNAKSLAVPPERLRVEPPRQEGTRPPEENMPLRASGGGRRPGNVRIGGLQHDARLRIDRPGAERVLPTLRAGCGRLRQVEEMPAVGKKERPAMAVLPAA